MQISSTAIILRNIRLHAQHGVLDQERLTGDEFIVNLRVAGDFAKACRTDSVDDTVNYAELYEIVKTEMMKPSRLIENVAYRIGQAILDSNSLVESVDVEVVKSNPPMGADCGGASVVININR